METSSFRVLLVEDSEAFRKFICSTLGKRPELQIVGEVSDGSEGVHLLWAQGNAEAAIQVEGLCDQLVKTYDVDTLCRYSLRSVQGGMESHIFQRICAEHSSLFSR